jgi:hypothetical protein
VNLNSILGAIDGKRDLFTEADFKLIKGEALGLRAFLHFEVLRLWGPVPKNASLSELAIPYVTEVTTDVDKLVSIPYGEVLELIIKDLNQAEELLVDDPITSVGRDVLNKPNNQVDGGELYYFRHTRFNLYAVKATKARYYLWAGDKAAALQSAREVIDGVVGETADPVFELCDGGYFNSNTTELTLIPEHIFAIHQENLGDVTRELYKTQGVLIQNEATLMNAYEIGGVSNSPNDIRWTGNRYWSYVQREASSQSDYVFKKYITPEDVRPEVKAKYVPLIRISEMYLIATECAGTLDQARSFFDYYRIRRNINADYTNVMVDDASVLARLEKEYRKEFFGEGQMFYFYKRQGTIQYTWPSNGRFDASLYVIPKPDNQITFE